MLAASIADAARASLPDQVVHLVDEQEHVAGGTRLGDERAETLLVLAAIRRAGEQRDGVEREQAQVAHGDGHGTRRDALRQTLRDRRLADAGRADERRIVLALPQEDVDRAGDLLVATADHLEASGARVGGEVAREARQRPGIGAFGTKGIVDHAVCADAEVRGCVRALKGARERCRRKERASPTHGFQMVHTGVRGRCRRGFLPHASRGGAIRA